MGQSFLGVRLTRPRARLVVALFLVAAALGYTLLPGVGSPRAVGSDPTRCQTFETQSRARAEAVTGGGPDLLVIGDSWSAGLGLADASRSWPARLPGSVHVSAFSGSGFSEHASSCGAVSYADRAPAALRGLSASTPVVLEGGLNDWDASDAAISSGFSRLVDALAGHPVTVVGPASAPSRAVYMPRIDALLGRLSRDAGWTYVSSADLDLPYLPDALHLMPAGHETFGDFVAARL
ncbi:SGNH/GDSL hydrolase family protein [Nocardioides acrostichi]|uniref:SGNH/GDSL hydrolase family protein n=1 Tax=Nocardioides acrostichi TaxID=2784339 RepID=A0A930UZ38_9ACTN|nr:SGNH/GDSL hydrolase family protein [Nocardioides acrostichi]MBF4161680.1 SGNH/GDSL hydrolase family protein [Nocardioides acrostichi]